MHKIILKIKFFCNIENPPIHFFWHFPKLKSNASISIGSSPLSKHVSCRWIAVAPSGQLWASPYSHSIQIGCFSNGLYVLNWQRVSWLAAKPHFVPLLDHKRTDGRDDVTKICHSHGITVTNIIQIEDPRFLFYIRHILQLIDHNNTPDRKHQEAFHSCRHNQVHKLHIQIWI